MSLRKFLAGVAVGCAFVVSAGINHPSLLFTPERVKSAKERMESGDSLMVKGWENIRRIAEAQLAKPDIMKLEYMALAWQMTGDRRYADKLKEVLMRTADTRSWANSEMMARNPAWRSELQMAHRSFQVAVAYDAIYDTLTPAERKHIAEGMWRLAGEPLLGDWLLEPTRIHSLNSMGHNWWTSCVGMGGVLAMAIGNEVPEAAAAAKKAVDALPEWFGFAGDVIQRKPRTFDRDGGMYESINYASFGITEALILRQAWLNSHPGANLPDIPQMRQLASFFSHVAYPRTGILHSINFGDSHKNVTGESSMLLALAQPGNASKKDMEREKAIVGWYVGQVEPGQHREGFPRTVPMGFLYTPDTSKAPAVPDLPKSHLWEDFGWATMRDSWEKDATMLAVKSGMTWNHSHADANSFIIFHKGVDIIKDAGNCSYGKPEYRNYFFQTEAHNVVRFNGQGQPRHQQYHGSMLPGEVTGLVDEGRFKYVLANGTGPMSRWLSRNYRHFLWIDNVIYVIDDLESHEPGRFEWLWHPGGDTRKRGYDLEVTNGDAAVLVRPIYPNYLAPSDYVHDYPQHLYWEKHEAPDETLKGTETYWSFHMPQTVDRVKGVTAVILKDSVAQKAIPQIERREGKDWIGLRVTATDGTVTDLYINQLADGRLMHLNSWIDADGFSTDAYMLAVTYPAGSAPGAASASPLASGKPSDIFMVHGSSLRRDGKVLHSSLDKRTLRLK